MGESEVEENKGRFFFRYGETFITPSCGGVILRGEY